ncbi:hypothetical protein ZTR_05968 [Talaromyces verruculosus]|nr:hypothetical protein ZTR_05968 [Talaromyces verruculosus]
MPRVGLSHHQLRHYISTADPDRVYFVAHKVVHSIHVKSQKWDTIERIPFEPKCLAAAYGWIVVGGSDNGECAFISLPGRDPRAASDTRPGHGAADVDAALPIELDADTRVPVAVAGTSAEQRPYLGVLENGIELPEIFTKTLTGSIVNSVTIHRLPANERLGFAHEDIAVFSNNDKTIKIFSLTRRQLLETKHHPKCMNYAVISPNSSLLAAVGDVNFAYFYRIAPDTNSIDYGWGGERLSGWTWDLCCRIELPLSTDLNMSPNFDDGSCFTIAFSPSSRLCAIGSQSGIISVYDVNVLLECVSGAQGCDARVALFRSSRTDSAGAVRSMAFSPEPWDLLVWVEDTGRFGIVDIRSGFFRRQIVKLDREDPEMQKVRPIYNSPYLIRSESEENDFGLSTDTSDRVASLRESVQGLTERERQIIEFLNTARSSSRQESDAEDRAPSTDSHSRQHATASSLGGATDNADHPSRATSPFRSTDAALQEFFREYYPGRVGSTERSLGQRRRASIVISQPSQGASPAPNVQSGDDSNNNATSDFQLRLRWTTSPTNMQSSEGTSHNNGASSEHDLGNNGSSTDSGQTISGAGPEVWNIAYPDEEPPTEAWQTSQRSRSIPRRIPRPGGTTESRYDAQRVSAAEMRASVAAERLRRQRLAANEVHSLFYFLIRLREYTTTNE